MCMIFLYYHFRAGFYILLGLIKGLTNWLIYQDGWDAFVFVAFVSSGDWRCVFVLHCPGGVVVSIL